MILGNCPDCDVTVCIACGLCHSVHCDTEALCTNDKGIDPDWEKYWDEEEDDFCDDSKYPGYMDYGGDH